VNCSNCGSDEDVSIRVDFTDHNEAVLCASCWWEWDHHADHLYCEVQFAFYNDPDDPDDRRNQVFYE
jgi:transcription elongation factor Elf1